MTPTNKGYAHCAAAGAPVDALELRRLLSAGQLDQSFGVGGVAAADAVLTTDLGLQVIQPDGKIVAIGTTGSATPGSTRALLLRFNPDGRLDRTFGSIGRVTTQIADDAAVTAAAESDGEIVVAATGDVYSNNSTVNEVLRYLPDGTLDRRFAQGGVLDIAAGPLESASAILIQPDGKIVIAGRGLGNSVDGFGLVRLTTNGELDPTFGTGGKVFTGFGAAGEGGIGALAILPNGELLAGGSVSVTDSNNHTTNTAALARYHVNGSLDKTFGTSGITLNPAMAEISSLALRPHGSFVAGGSDASSAIAAAQFTASGSLDLRFGKKGVVESPVGNSPNRYGGGESVLLQKNGSLILIGSTGDTLMTAITPVCRFTAGGILDKAFGWTNSGATQLRGGFGDGILQSDGKIVVIGASGLCRLTNSGQPDPAFGGIGVVSNPNGITGPIRAMAQQNDGKIIVAGNEIGPTVKDFSEAVVARYNADGSLDMTFGINGRAYLHAGGNARFNSIVIQSDGTIVASGFGRPSISGPMQFLLARFLANGRLDPSLGHGGWMLASLGDPVGQQFNALALQPDGKLVAAGREGGAANSSSTAGSRIVVARFAANGSLDPTFGSAGWVVLDPYPLFSDGALATAVALQKDGKIVVSGNIGPDFAVVRLTTSGALDPTFASGGIAATPLSGPPYIYPDQTHTMAIDASGRILVGGALGSEYAVVFRYLPDGTLDAAFGNAGVLQLPSADYFPSDSINALAIEPDGKIIVAGNDVGTVVARLNDKGVDPTFGNKGIASISDKSPIGALLVVANGRILLAAGSDLIRLLGK